MTPDFGFASLVFTVFSIIGGIATHQFENPKSDYKDDISTIQSDRLSYLSDDLGTLVSQAYEFMRDTEGQSPEQLSSQDQAAVAITDVLDTPEDISNLRGKAEDYFRPPEVYQSCRQYRDWGSLFFIIGASSGLFPPVIRFQYPDLHIADLFAFGTTIVAFIVSLGGLVCLIQFIRTRRQLDEMTEQADFDLDS